MDTLQKRLNKFHKLKFKMESIKADIAFLDKCIKHNIYPRFVQISCKIKNKRAMLAVEKARKTWIKLEKRYLYGKVNSLELETYSLHLKIIKKMNSSESACWQGYLSKMHEVISHKIKSKNITIRKKFLNLRNNHPKSKKPIVHAIPDFIVNQSSKVLTKEEEELLNHGLNFALQTERNVTNIIADIEVGIKHMSQETKNEIRHSVSKTFSSNPAPKPPQNKYLEIVQKLKRDQSIVITKADKNNSVIIINKTDYDERVNNMIAENEYTPINRSPLSKMCAATNTTTKIISSLLADNKLKYMFKMSNPRVPLLYALPKTHKPGNKMRPIASNIRSPTQNIAKWLINEFRKIKQPQGFDVKNTVELVEKINTQTIKRNEILVSFDVTSLYPSIPNSIALEYMEDWLIAQNTPKNQIDAFKEAATLCINQNYIEFRSNYYKQQHGVAMGNPVSSFIANLFMCRFETDISTNKKFPKLWYRYVDDIICIVNKRKVEDTLKWLNSFYPTIQFTHEKEDQNGKIAFLDITIQRTENNNLTFSIYRKPTATERYITANSHHSIQHKKSAFNSMIFRLLNIPMNDANYNDELKYIYMIAEKNGFNKKFVDNIYKKMKRKHNLRIQTTHRAENKKERKYMSIEYAPPLTNQIQTMLKKYDIEIVTKSTKRVKTITSNLKDRTETMEKSGVYKIKCDNCEKVYVGQTRRKLKIRYREHRKAMIKQNLGESAVADHMKENNHVFNIDNVKLIHECYDRRRLDVLESIEINKLGDQIMNAEQGPMYSTLFKHTKK